METGNNVPPAVNDRRKSIELQVCYSHPLQQKSPETMLVTGLFLYARHGRNAIILYDLHRLLLSLSESDGPNNI